MSAKCNIFYRFYFRATLKYSLQNTWNNLKYGEHLNNFRMQSFSQYATYTYINCVGVNILKVCFRFASLLYFVDDVLLLLLWETKCSLHWNATIQFYLNRISQRRMANSIFAQLYVASEDFCTFASSIIFKSSWAELNRADWYSKCDCNGLTIAIGIVPFFVNAIEFAYVFLFVNKIKNPDGSK